MTGAAPAPLPPGTRVLHIGPHKTGTTSLQGAFHRSRRSAAGHGVHYAGRNRQPGQAAQAAAARRSARHGRRALGPWHELLHEIRGAPAERVVISSEWFADADDVAIRLLVEDLDPARVHVVVTVRPLASIIPSQWQQYVQAGMTTGYEPWLKGVFGEPSSPTPTFWHRHRHDELVRRWAGAVGVGRVTVVVADDRDHTAVLRAFEHLVGLPAGLLVPDDARANRSLTRGEIELLRAVHAAMSGAGLDHRRRHDLVLFGAAPNLKVRDPAIDEPRIETPPWAVEPIANAAAEIVAGLRASGVRIVGDLDQLAGSRPRRAPRRAPRGPGMPGDARWPEVAALGAMGVLIAAGLAHGDRRTQRWPEEPAALDVTSRGGARLSSVALDGATAPFSTPRIRNVVVGRVRRAVAVRLPWLRRRRDGASRRTARPAEAAPPIHSARSEVE